MPILSTTGRALRNVRPAGGAKKETQLGTCDTAGNLTLHLQSNVSMSPKRIFNVCDYGAVGDGQYDIGTGTDNYAAIMACLTAIKASRYNFLHGGATMYFPQGMYRIYQQIPITFPVSIEGDGVGTVFPSTVIFGNDASDNEVGLFWLQTQGEAADGLVGSAGVSISRIGLAQSHPALQWGINANFRPGARATTARRTIPSPKAAVIGMSSGAAL